MFRVSSSVALERLAASVCKKVGGSSPSSSTNISLCSGSSDGSEAEKSTSRHRLGSSGIEQFTVKVVEEQGSTLISMLQKRRKGRWFESIPERQILRMSSSVFRAPCGFGYKGGGGSNPSSSTNLTLGSYLAHASRWRKRVSIRLMEWITRRTWLGLHGLTGGSIPPLGAYCDGSIGNVCGCKYPPLQDNATINGKLAKAVRLAVSNQREVFGRRGFESSPSRHFYGYVILPCYKKSLCIEGEKYYD